LTQLTYKINIMTQSTSRRGFVSPEIEDRQRVSSLGSQTSRGPAFEGEQNYNEYEIDDRYNDYYEERYEARPEYYEDYYGTPRWAQYQGYYESGYAKPTENWLEHRNPEYGWGEHTHRYRNASYLNSDYDKAPYYTERAPYYGREAEYEDYYGRPAPAYYGRPLSIEERYRFSNEGRPYYYGQQPYYAENEYYARPAARYPVEQRYPEYYEDRYERAEPRGYFEPARGPVSYYAPSPYYEERANYGYPGPAYEYRTPAYEYPQERRANTPHPIKGFSIPEHQEHRRRAAKPHPAESRNPYQPNPYQPNPYEPRRGEYYYEPGNRPTPQRGAPAPWPHKRGYTNLNPEERTRIARMGAKTPQYAR
jgi:hypothetical protein